jgi:hypothetical protein
MQILMFDIVVQRKRRRPCVRRGEGRVIRDFVRALERLVPRTEPAA